MSVPFLYRAWVAASMVLVPFAALIETRKLRRAGISVQRAHEKIGHATEPRQDAVPLVWFHAASVGESLSVLALIARIGVHLPQAQFLITSGTATSAKLLASRLPPRTVHQFAPFDAPGPLRRFLKHWHPDAAVFVESEIWPQMLRRTHATGAKLAMVNARLSERSMARWGKFPNSARYLLDVFSLILTQNDRMAQGMVDMHAPADRVARGINLKSMAGPLPVDEDALFEARTAIAHRPVWVASSTHEGEEQAVLAAHKTLLKSHPDLCLILAPRHPERGTEVMNMIAGAGLSLTRRTRGDMPGAQVFLADTMGELGLWYDLADIVFLGGSLKPIGGHNPFEVAQSGACVLSGPHVAAFAETYAEMEAQGAARLVADGDDLAAQVDQWLSDAAHRAQACAAARDYIDGQTDLLDGIATRLITALELTP
ncbi:3-deoxy-D-manno-octulosonic acid transferase [Sulfitobacter sp. M57]|uniref:3-deoxy-D-manno-octulosonic acid transferase n=1 Tax=unclassified Sulfitobacter TaxID=196795 RepID=UPI0023E136AD|nr:MULTISPECIES: 3-deoxy-D-manno-octulosonic acid transferase [unclassified Sulfitobacter]MDF3414070.1 3-deoxy-D-manno-octulosonic acid transferase [Sulfitobacter sp. KE5]MDF3420649.1 3-deoxy-D-manno-octulosonic acid transferase [Sulfitobacter sp. KE43]MDF3432616.1 3-deoxy-D-manno-octulosonic acid transferase [Sulfitobacter sp. KE42]MDF3458255.1 3-deoxy-D-manno-octulosonic acid transferase [Sulfitobacter sp. S74]MDF3462156.1 3-deoxy-D-manno-octulosonic acid transferase [Sulfitobacter sp. Ks18]